MRLFVAVELSENVKSELIRAIEALGHLCVKGRFTRPENLHLTLAFIGETKRLAEAKSAVDSLNAAKFNLTVGGLGAFKRAGGDVYWAGVEKNDRLFEIQDALCAQLKNAGFELENRQYKPHITLGREVILSKTPDFKLEETCMTVDAVTLFSSEREGGRLIYTPVFTKRLL